VRIKRILLTWFRGAADPVALEPDSKSMVVYGVNGSGKSTFVDAIEYIVHDGRIGHLSHEYSGKHQEKGVPNTHKPKDRHTEIAIKFATDGELKTAIATDGTLSTSGAEAKAMAGWDYRQTVLRQNEVAAFIHDTKGGKYSALLPLLGLHHMEVAAENLRQLSKVVEQQAKVRENRVVLKELATKRKEVFGTASDSQIAGVIKQLYSRYCADGAATEDPIIQCGDLQAELTTRFGQFSADQRRHLVLQEVGGIALKTHIGEVRATAANLVGITDPLIGEKLEIVRSAGAFAARLEETGEVICPACGQSIGAAAFQAHIQKERTKLQDISDAFDGWKASVGTLCDDVRTLKTSTAKADIKTWRQHQSTSALLDHFRYLDAANIEALRKSCKAADLDAIEGNLVPIVEAAASATKDALPDVQQLSDDRRTGEVAKAVLGGRELGESAARAIALVAFIDALEATTRKEIRVRSQKIVDEISADVQAMWKILHPDAAIQHVRLYLAKDTDKAIDIGLKFYGLDQDSPRLTLSEGYRNSLGLCIFLAMAKREAIDDVPLFLDDVVVSLDRSHRGMVVELLEKQFADRQVIILTHDRDWYVELRHLLDAKTWTFKALRPYETPDVGIRWSHTTTTFGDARAQLDKRPDSAGNDARKIMDTELSLVAERLQIRMPYLRAERNDRRVAHEFLERMISDGGKCLQRRDDKTYVAHAHAIEVLEKADKLIIAWGNRASHSFDLEKSEAAKLIDACEAALDIFRCPSCSRNVWFAEAAPAEQVQCECGEIRWRYGRG
jgi:energy-coupling factor transporter ATP-binding protein EcfA2